MTGIVRVTDSGTFRGLAMTGVARVTDSATSRDLVMTGIARVTSDATFRDLAMTGIVRVTRGATFRDLAMTGIVRVADGTTFRDLVITGTPSDLPVFPRQYRTSEVNSTDSYAETTVRNVKWLLNTIMETNKIHKSLLYRIEAELETAYEHDSNIYQGNRVYLWEQIADLWFRTQEYEHMEHCLIRKASVQPGSADAFLNLGYYFEQIHQVDKAIDSYLKGLSINPHDEFVLHNLARLYHEFGDKALALRAINDAILIHPRLPTIFDLKGEMTGAYYKG
jgi:hypothetical protein